MHVMRYDRLHAWLFAAASAGLCILLAVVGPALFYRSGLTFPINYNEGWNSYNVDRVLQGLVLYPGKETRLINNYPPLSFYLVAAVSRLSGDVLFAGRATAWFSFFACTALIGLIARRIGCNRSAAAYATIFFAAVMVTRHDLYIGMFDPQLSGMALMLSGLFVLLGARGAGGGAAAALLMVAGGFVKHSLVAVPITVFLWLAWCNRSLFWAWLATGVSAGAAGLVLCIAVYGHTFLESLAAPRRVDLPDGMRKVLRWLLPVELPCILATLPVAFGDPNARLVGIYLIVGLLSGVLGAALSATNYNMIFDVMAATSLGIGLLASGRFQVPGSWAALAGTVSLWISALQLATVETASWHVWSARQLERDAQARAAIAAIRLQPGPALCGDLLLCFLAGKSMPYDPLNFGWAPNEDQASLRQDIAAQRFGVIQISISNTYLSPATYELIKENYGPLPGFAELVVPLSENAGLLSKPKARAKPEQP